MEKYHPFWERTKNLIRAHKISQEKFAAYIGISFNTFKCWICHNRIPDAITACDIADALGVPLEYLVRGNNSKEKEREKRVLGRKTAAIGIRKLAKKIEREVRKIS